MVNAIKPVKRDDQDFCVPDEPNNDAITCFSGNVAVDSKHVLYVNEINPVPLIGCTTCNENVDPCASTHMSGNIGIKQGHYFGQLDDIILDCAEPLSFYGEEPDGDEFPPASQLGFPITQCTPVLRLTFKNTDPNNSQTPFPQGAWVRLSLMGKAHLNLMTDCTVTNGECHFPRTVSTDIFSELYFFVGAGFNAPCSSLVGSLSNINPDSGFNTLSGFGCKTEFFSTERRPQARAINPGFPWGTSLFEFMPTADNASPITMLGTIATSALQPNVADILLTGMLRTIDLDAIYIVHPVDANNQPTSVTLADVINVECPFFIDNVSIFYEVISPNLDPNHPPCFPQSPLDPCANPQACLDLVATFTTAAPSPNDTPDFDNDYIDLGYEPWDFVFNGEVC